MSTTARILATLSTATREDIEAVFTLADTIDAINEKRTAQAATQD